MNMDQPNFTEWEQLLQDPLWYVSLASAFRELATLRQTDPSRYETLKEEIYDFFEGCLLSDTVALGDTGKPWDTERAPIDTVIVHHTSNLPGMRATRLSAIELIRLYAPHFANPPEEDKEIAGQPIYSGHFRDGKQVFWPYQWLIRSDGRAERLLHDTEIGWQAGKWSVNCRSVALCFDGDFEHSMPSEIELRAAAAIIRNQYPAVSKDRVWGHCEVNTKTTCPSTHFLGTENQDGWKAKLLDLI